MSKLMSPPTRTIVQVAALPWRWRGDDIEVMLVTSRQNRKWMLPKGWVMVGKTDCQAAAREAFEESGVRGQVSPRPVGSYRYLKDKAPGQNVPAQAMVFPLFVTELVDDYPEAGQREREWMSLRKAAKLVYQPDLKRLLADLDRGWRPKR